MRKKITILLVLILCVSMVFAMAACDGFGGSNGGDNNSNNDGSSSGSGSSSGDSSSSGSGSSSGNSSSSGSGSSSGNGSSSGSNNQAAPMPTSAEIVEARSNATSDSVQGYDFTLSIRGNFSVLGIGSSVNGLYNGSYRYDGDSDEVTFKRTSSGALLPDSTCYMFTSGDSQIKATMDGNTVKKISVELPEDQDITMVNLPIVKIVDSVGASNISGIKKSTKSGYTYTCTLSPGSSTLASIGLSKVFEKLGTGVSFKGITFAENTSTLDFNIKDGKLNDFALSFNMQISIGSAKTTISVEYTQVGNTTRLSMPNISGFVYKTADVQSEVSAINTAIEDLKDDPVYSLDLLAKNDFDPGWNKTAIVDQYTARMYKNTVADFVSFNHSFVYKSHTETAGKETYKYTLGNVNGDSEDNQGSWLISRKGTNSQDRADGVTADTQFDFLTAIVKLQASEIDCIEKNVSGATTTYNIYLGKSATLSVQEKIAAMINTNNFDDDVIEVNNYLNSDNVVKEASLTIVINDGKISSIVCDTEIIYTPTGGDYTEYNVTLKNTIDLQVNANYDKAADYTAPKTVKTALTGLNAAKYYIL